MSLRQDWFKDTPLISWLMEIIVAMDGAPQGEASWFSLSCLMQPPSPSWLAEAKHHEFSEAVRPAQDSLAAYQHLNTAFVVLSWNCLPFLVVASSAVFCFVVLDRFMRSRKHVWPDALDFYAKVSLFGAQVLEFWDEASRVFYVQLYQRRLLGLFGPLSYALSFSSGQLHFIRLWTFWQDHAPAGAPGISSHVLRGGAQELPHPDLRRPGRGCGLDEAGRGSLPPGGSFAGRLVDARRLVGRGVPFSRGASSETTRNWGNHRC
ncbi:unnamed protein product [Effrenium voratum]|uniref:Uncharacterized protein n=1 Tax=Effrenium voratum TaxID=2562239 RepID=A0AA36J7S7_9DINO|nr:unnamed protein product [Effrenium voratum]